jgi:hypothetical protein
MDLLVEADRIEDKFNLFRSLLPSLITATKSASRSAVQSEEIVAISDTITNIYPEEYSSRNLFSEVSVSESTLSMDYCTDSIQSNMSENQLLLPVASLAASGSRTMCVGSRCCFRWPNKQSPCNHLGTIIDVCDRRMYSVSPYTRYPKRFSSSEQKQLTLPHLLDMPRQFQIAEKIDSPCGRRFCLYIQKYPVRAKSSIETCINSK